MSSLKPKSGCGRDPVRLRTHARAEARTHAHVPSHGRAGKASCARTQSAAPAASAAYGHAQDIRHEPREHDEEADGQADHGHRLADGPGEPELQVHGRRQDVDDAAGADARGDAQHHRQGDVRGRQRSRQPDQRQGQQRPLRGARRGVARRGRDGRARDEEAHGQRERQLHGQRGLGYQHQTLRRAPWRGRVVQRVHDVGAGGAAEGEVAVGGDQCVVREDDRAAHGDEHVHAGRRLPAHGVQDRQVGPAGVQRERQQRKCPGDRQKGARPIGHAALTDRVCASRTLARHRARNPTVSGPSSASKDNASDEDRGDATQGRESLQAGCILQRTQGPDDDKRHRCHPPPPRDSCARFGKQEAKLLLQNDHEGHCAAPRVRGQEHGTDPAAGLAEDADHQGRVGLDWRFPPVGR
mmetsp:Transcript_85395/g.265486  ORF Transcript_85395/g.265486 Transcript_85395/m.265486 type:complete len:411 (+) Transcript_85395:168-1400(+)